MCQWQHAKGRCRAALKQDIHVQAGTDTETEIEAVTGCEQLSLTTPAGLSKAQHAGPGQAGD